MMAEAKGESPRVLNVGQCNFDHPRITRFLAEHFNAKVDRAHKLDEARGLMEKNRYDLVLVNRLLDVDQTSGIDVIRTLKGETAFADVPMMLVSNYPDAQQAAVEAGAELGFGKAEYDREETVNRLASVLN
jgi:DNA-binding response OmpR family regulator